MKKIRIIVCTLMTLPLVTEAQTPKAGSEPIRERRDGSSVLSASGFLMKALGGKIPASGAEWSGGVAIDENFERLLVGSARNCEPVSERKGFRSGMSARDMMNAYRELLDRYVASGRKELLDASVATANQIASEEISVSGSGSSCGRWYVGKWHQHEYFKDCEPEDVTLAWMALCERLLKVTGVPFWADQFERSLYNAFLRTPDKAGLDMLERSLLQSEGGEVFVNYYVPSRSTVKVGSADAAFAVDTRYPEDGRVDIRFEGSSQFKFPLSFRVPDWCGSVVVKLNGAEVSSCTTNGGYVRLERVWKKADVLSLDFALPVRTHRLENCTARSRGPLVLRDGGRIWTAEPKTPESVLPGKPRLDRSKLQIGAYYFYFKDGVKEEYVKDLADCGIDFVISSIESRDTLDLFQKYGVGCFLGRVLPNDWYWPNIPGYPTAGGRWAWHGLAMHTYDKAAEKFVDHPAVWAITSRDEPSAMDFSYYRQAELNLMRNFPAQFPYMNLNPINASPIRKGRDPAVSPMGAHNYVQYISEYCEKIPLDYICYDYYLWGWKNVPRTFFENLRIVADACAGTGKSHWIVLQALTYEDRGNRRRRMNEATLRYQANAALAYGVEVITWASWTRSWWTDSVVGSNGVKSVLYEPLKRVNRDLHRISPDYMRYKRVTTDLVGFDHSEKISHGPAFKGVCAVDGSQLAVGHFVSRRGSGEYAMFIAACDDPEGERPKDMTVGFRCSVPGLTVHAKNKQGPVPVTRTGDGRYSVPLSSSRGVMVFAEKGKKQ